MKHVILTKWNANSDSTKKSDSHKKKKVNLAILHSQRKQMINSNLIDIKKFTVKYASQNFQWKCLNESAT